MESTPSSSSSSEASSAISLEERVARAKQLLAERQAQKAKEEEQVSLSSISVWPYYVANPDSDSKATP